MNESNATINPNDVPVYMTELVPHRSLGRKGLKVLFSITGVLSVVHVIFFLTAGAWPIAIFFGADFIVLFGAFWLNNRAARAREQISLSRMELSIRKISPAGLTRESRFNPFWTRVKIARHPEIGVTSIKVSGQGMETAVGDFLYPEAREKFASDFTRALATVKQRI